MINLKVAEYKEGKFERFIELSMNRDGFGYYGDRILLRKFIKTNAHPVYEYLDTQDVYDLDQKDPLNRFDGLFNNRSYGNGRFVLVRDDEDVITKCDIGHCIYYLTGNRIDDEDKEYETRSIIGNLHENPELWEKVNYKQNVGI